METVAFIILLPGLDRTEKEMAHRIVRMVSELEADALQCNIAIPYPGSKMFDAYNRRYKMSDDWSHYDPAGNSVPYPTELDLIKARRMVYLGFFLKNPAYILKTLARTNWLSLFAFLKNSRHVLFGSSPS